MIRVKKVVWEEKGENVDMCIEYELDTQVNKMQVSGICTDCIDNQGFTEEWIFSVNGREVYVIYSHFEDSSFASQIAEGILNEFYPYEKGQIIVESGVM